MILSVYSVQFSCSVVSDSLRMNRSTPGLPVVFNSGTPRTAAHKAPPFKGFSRQEYWSGLPFPPPGDLPDTGIEPMSPSSAAWQVDSFPLSHLGSAKIVVTNIS